MDTVKNSLEHLLGEDIVSLEIQDVLGSQIIYLTYRDSVPTSVVEAHILSHHHEAEFGELIRIYSEEVISNTYSSLYSDTDYDRYWEDPEVGERLDHYLADKTFTHTSYSIMALPLMNSIAI